MARLPNVGGDAGNWGALLNEFLAVGHHSDGTIRVSAISSHNADGTIKESALPAIYFSSTHFEGTGTISDPIRLKQ